VDNAYKVAKDVESFMRLELWKTRASLSSNASSRLSTAGRQEYAQVLDRPERRFLTVDSSSRQLWGSADMRPEEREGRGKLA
jgi:hypothetical protein